MLRFLIVSFGRFLIVSVSLWAIMQVEVSRDQFKIQLPDGKYTCIATLPGLFAFYDKTCHVVGGKLKKDIIFSPVVAPGMARVVLTWGAAVKDLDSFLLTP